MELPCYIGGFTSLVGGLQYISYVEYGSVDAKDKYRLTGMSSCGGTPTGMAIRYMTARLKMLMYGREAQSKTRIASPATIPKSGERNRKIHSCMLYLISI